MSAPIRRAVSLILTAVAIGVCLLAGAAMTIGVVSGSGVQKQAQVSRRADVERAASPVARDQVMQAYAELPLAFVENQGQTDARVRYSAQGSGFAFYLTREEVVLALVKGSGSRSASGIEPVATTAAAPEAATRGVALALRFLDANSEVALEAEERAPGEVNFFHGNDPARWRTKLARYGRIVYRELWPGVDMALSGRAGELKYEFRARPGARVADIQLAYRGSSALVLDDAGGLLIETPLGVLRDAPPAAYQEIAGKRVAVESRYALNDGGDYGFTVGAGYDPAYELIIDPGVRYSTFLGGASHETGDGIAVDAAGNAYVVGTTQSVDFPATLGAFDRTLAGPSNPPDVFVSKLSANGSALVYATYLGGGSNEFGRAIAIDAAGNAYVTGQTTSRDFPTTGGAFISVTPQPPPLGSPNDAFVTKLNVTGSALVYSTFLGGGQDIDDGLGIAVDGAGNAYVTGETGSSDFPTTAGAFDRTKNGAFDAFVTKLNPTGSAPVFSTFLGGLEVDYGQRVKIDAANNAYMMGPTRSADFPTTPGAFDTTHNGAFDVFVSKLNPTGSALVYSAFLGGLDFDSGAGLALDAAGNAYVAGGTLSLDFPTTPGALGTTPHGNDAFVTKLNAAGSALVYSTFLGGSAGTGCAAIALDAAGDAYLAGGTSATDFPTTADGFETVFNGGASDAFVARLNAAGSALVYSTFLGGTNSEFAADIGLDAAGNAYVSGTTYSPDFPTTPGAFDRIWNGDPLIFWGDAFVASFTFGPAGPIGLNVASLTLSPTTVAGGSSATGRVTLSGPAPAGGAAVSLGSSNPAVASVPPSVTVAAGATSATFAVTTVVVGSTTTVSITGTLGAVVSAPLTVTALAVPGAPGLVSPADQATVAQPITFDWTDVSGAATYEIQIDNSSTIAAPFVASATVAVSQFTTSSLPAQRLWWRVRAVNAAGGAGAFSATRRLEARAPAAPPAPASLAAVGVNPTSVVGGAGSTGTVTLSAAAPAGGSTVALASSVPALASLPASVTVAAGTTSASFSITTNATTASTPVTISGTFGGVSRSAVLTVNPAAAAPSLSAVTVNPTSLAGGTAATGTVTLTAAAPAGGAVVTLSSSNTPVASVPPSATVPAGALSTTFAVSTAVVTLSTPVSIGAAFGGASRSATLTVNPASQAATLTVTATGRSGERVTSSPAGINVAVGSTGTAPFATGTSITLAATNGRDVIWSGACSSGGNKTRTCTFTFGGSASVNANVQ